MSTQPKNRTAKTGIAVAALLAAAAMGAAANGIGAYWTSSVASSTETGQGALEITAGRFVDITTSDSWSAQFRYAAPGWAMAAAVPDPADRTVTLTNTSTQPMTVDLTSTVLGLDDGTLPWVKPGAAGFGQLVQYGFWMSAAIDTNSDGTPEATHTYGDPAFPGTFANLTAANGTITTAGITLAPGQSAKVAIDAGFHNWKDLPEFRPAGTTNGNQGAAKYDGLQLKFSLVQSA